MDHQINYFKIMKDIFINFGKKLPRNIINKFLLNDLLVYLKYSLFLGFLSFFFTYNEIYFQIKIYV